MMTLDFLHRTHLLRDLLLLAMIMVVIMIMIMVIIKATFALLADPLPRRGLETVFTPSQPRRRSSDDASLRVSLNTH